jgi:hypothetical protein
VITQVRASNAVTNQWHAAEAQNPSKRLGTEDSKPLMAELIVSSSNALLCTKLYLRRMEEWRREIIQNYLGLQPKNNYYVDETAALPAST